jgi:parallel beta-helix repeat protein
MNQRLSSYLLACTAAALFTVLFLSSLATTAKTAQASGTSQGDAPELGALTVMTTTTPTSVLATASSSGAGLKLFLPVAYRQTAPPPPSSELVPIPPIATMSKAPAWIPFPVAPAGTQPTVTKKTVDGFETVIIDGPGITIDIPGIAAAANGIALANGPLLVNEGNNVWRLTASLRIGKQVTLRITRDTVAQLKLRSNTSASTSIDKSSYVVLDTIDGAILIENTSVTSWDSATSAPDTTPKNGRAFLRAYGLARMDVLGSEIAYLGNPDGGGSYGLSFRDEEQGPGGEYLARVRGDVINNRIHHLYYGYFSFAAAGVTIRGNKFYENDSYGFDPHDFSYDYVVEDNEAYNNGNHGFIISRGCHSFTFRRNKSYGNIYKVDSKTYRAHGFMIDPGGLNSDGGDYTPSYNVLLENNEAYNNQGYGIRVLDANSNTIRSNVFSNNLIGISIERGSFHNTVQNNQLAGNAQSGIAFDGDNSLGHPNNNVIANNAISGNGREGVYLNDRSTANELRGNAITGNGVGIRAIAETRLNFWMSNTIWGNPNGAIDTTTGVNGSIDAPTIAGINPTTLAGRAQPGALIDVFSSDDGQAQYYEGRTVADAAGNWQHTITGPWRGARVTASQTMPAKGSSELANAVGRP